MTTALTPFQQSAGLPAHLADINENTNIVERESIPQLSFRGKVWRIVIAGEETIVKRSDGEPSSTVIGVILDYNKARSRAFFEGAYVEGQASKPTCWSHDGVVPHESVVDKQAATCASCPQSAKGSKVTPDGKQVTACSQFKRAVFVPIANTKFQPLLLKLPQTSIWDKDGKENEAAGFYAFDQYLDFLKRKGVNHTAAVVTKIKFDQRNSYPKLLFGPMDWLPEGNVQDIKDQLAKVDELNKILNVDPAGGEPGADAAAEAGAAPATAAPAAKPAAAKPAAPKPAPPPPPAPKPDDDDAGAGSFGAAPAAPAAPAVAPKPAAKPVAPKPAPAAAAAPAAPEVVAEGDAKAAGIGALLSAWDNE